MESRGKGKKCEKVKSNVKSKSRRRWKGGKRFGLRKRDNKKEEKDDKKSGGQRRAEHRWDCGGKEGGRERRRDIMILCT